MRHQDGRFESSDGIDIFYQVWLPEMTPTAVLLIVHGLGEHSGRYQNYVDYFVPRDYALWVMDLRGCGRSGGRRGHIDRFDDYVNDLRRLHDLAREANPYGKMFVLGHSYGSLIALTYGLRHPEGLSRVISSGTALRDALPYPRWVRSIIRRAGQVVPTLSLPSGLKIEYLSRDKAVVDAYRRDPLVHSVGTLRWASESIVIREWLYSQAANWKLPLLMLHGGDDTICLKEGAKVFRDKIGNSRVTYREYPRMYHELHNEINKESVFADIETWLSEGPQRAT
jgi:alpha-beta hydrolase superfamily lysophospholipase